MATTTRRGKPFAKVRADHSTETAEDYVEAISDIVEREGECRVKDLTAHMAVSHVTVVRIVARLKREKLVLTEPHRPIRLTAKGKRLAASSRQRHEIVHAFLLAIGVPDRDAGRDAEGIEHHVSRVTLDRMRIFVDHREGRSRS